MVSNMEHLHQNAPAIHREERADIPCTEDQITLQVDEFHHILMGRDQLTVARARGAQRIRENSESASEYLQGLIPIVEDWHAKQCLMGVRMQH